VHVLCGPAGSGKTARLRQRWLDRARRAPGEALWLGPTRRAVEEVRAEILREAGSLVGVQMLAFADFLDQIVRHSDPTARPLSDVQRRLLTADLLATLHSAGRVHHFERVLEMRGFGEGLLGLFEELRRAGITPAAFATAAEQTGAKGNPCAAIYAAYDRELSRGRLFDHEGRAWHARDLLQRGRRRPFQAVKAVFLDGFTDFTPAQSGVLAVLAETMEEVWISLPDEAGDERAELFSRPRQTLRQLELLREPTASASRHPEAPSRETNGEGEKQLSLFPPSTDDESDSAARTRWHVERLTNSPAAPGLPAGLVHLERQLFRPPRRVETSADATGVEIVEAPGILGEVRLVARRIKALLLRGVAANAILVISRDSSAYADSVREVFDEYGIPADIEGTEPLTRNPAITLLLRALRLRDDDWPFAEVTALLRHTYFRPKWEELAEAPELPQKAEALLRLLGEPRGREAYLRAIDRWAREQQPGLEDEQAEESRRRRTHELASQCGPFLHRFFRIRDDTPDRASLADHTANVRHLADDLGITEMAARHRADRAALELLLEELDRWAEHGPAGTLDRKTFLRRLVALAGATGLPRTPSGSGRVRVLSAKQARHLGADFVFLVGLGERGFPHLTPSPSLFDEAERQALQPIGLPPSGAADLLLDEMLLFYQVVTRARLQLVLSYPAVDERGHALLPGSFLSAVLACFQPGVVPVERRSMLIEGYDRDTPLSANEFRVRIATACRNGKIAGRLPGDLGANLADALDLFRRRFRDREHNPYDGLFRDPAVIADVARVFGPERIFSPTALEDYVACPFKFFLRHALHLEPLSEPREEIAVTRRGQALHRALARLHRQLREDAVHLPTDAVVPRARDEMARAVEEDIRRAPSLAAQELWRLEGQRLLRLAGRYGDQWQRFVDPWLEKGIAPQPYHFEIDFGLPSPDGNEIHGPLVIRVDGVEIRISGRIDRVDMAELSDGTAGFWIIDYKTGSSAHHTGSDLAQFRRLQLTLYALAVEEVLLADRKARPLGLAYWLVGEKGPKVALPARTEILWLTETTKWRAVRETLQGWVTSLVSHIRAGAFQLQPRSDKCTETCAYGQICRITQARAVSKPGLLELPVQMTPIPEDKA
jgi:ATP-dependent helicase/nuclease subunit B